MDDTPRRDTGEFDERVSDDDLLEAVREYDPAATSEVADAVGVTRQAADYRLRRLADEGRVQKKKIGASLVWSPAPTPQVGGSGHVPSVGGEHDAPEPEPDPLDGLRERLEDLDIPGSGPKRERRIDLLEDLVRYVYEHEGANSSELKAQLPENPGGYRDAESFWANVVRGKGGAFRELDDVHAPDSSGDVLPTRK